MNSQSVSTSIYLTKSQPKQERERYYYYSRLNYLILFNIPVLNTLAPSIGVCYFFTTINTVLLVNTALSSPFPTHTYTHQKNYICFYLSEDVKSEISFDFFCVNKIKQKTETSPSLLDNEDFSKFVIKLKFYFLRLVYNITYKLAIGFLRRRRKHERDQEGEVDECFLAKDL